MANLTRGFERHDVDGGAKFTVNVRLAEVTQSEVDLNSTVDEDADMPVWCAIELMFRRLCSEDARRQIDGYKNEYDAELAEQRAETLAGTKEPRGDREGADREPAQEPAT